MTTELTTINSTKSKDTKIKTIRIWRQSQNILPEGMPQKINYQKRRMKESINILNGEWNSEKNKERIYNFKNKESKYISSKNIKENISPYAKKILYKIGQNVQKIKQSILDITKMNSLYLEEKAKKTIEPKKNKKITIAKLKLRKNKSIIDLFSKTQNFKEKYLNNFILVNDNYRKQLNYAFLKYNPISHLESLKLLVEEPSIRDNIVKLNEEVEEDIKLKCDKFFFKKKYESFVEKRKRQRNRSTLQQYCDKPKNIDKLPNIKKMRMDKKNISMVVKMFNDNLNKKGRKRILCR